MPQNVVMLTADAFGVLPPISQLTPAQAMYHFLSGYTARVAGTEKGVDRAAGDLLAPASARRSCRATRTVYAKLLAELIARHGADCWLVNTGWSGGAYRRRQAHVDPAHPRPAARRARRQLAAGGVRRPTRSSACRSRSALPGVPAEVLNPREHLGRQGGLRPHRARPRSRFEKNFEAF